MNEFQTLNLSKPGKDRKPSSVNVENESLIEDGNEAMKRFSNISVVRGSKERNLGKMIVRDSQVIEGQPETTVKSVQEKYLWLKLHGFPVAPTFRYDSEKEKYLITDFSENGKYAIVDNHNPVWVSRTEIRNIDEVKATILEIAKDAYSDGEGVFLEIDPFLIKVDKQTGIGSVHLSDIFRGSFRLQDHVPKGYKDAVEEESAVALAEHFISSTL